MIVSEATLSNFLNLLDNAVLAWGLIACGLAQCSKVVFELIWKKKWRPSIFFETGGMPSSHSALVAGTTAGLGVETGFSDPLFAFAVAISFIVMYDASGVRRSAGLIASRVNQLAKDDNNSKESLEQPLKENLGHTRLEVLVGSFLGPVVAVPGIVFIGSPLHLLQLIGLITV